MLSIGTYRCSRDWSMVILSAAAVLICLLDVSVALPHYWRGELSLHGADTNSGWGKRSGELINRSRNTVYGWGKRSMPNEFIDSRIPESTEIPYLSPESQYRDESADTLIQGKFNIDESCENLGALADYHLQKATELYQQMISSRCFSRK